MHKLNCPHCGKPGISVMRKMFLGPLVPATCKACGKKVGVPYTKSLLAFIPFLAVIIAVVIGTEIVEPFALKAALWIVGIVVLFIIQLRWPPLEPR